MKTKIKSVFACAALAAVSITAMRYGRDKNYLPSDNYKEAASEVFGMFDEEYATSLEEDSMISSDTYGFENTVEVRDYSLVYEVLPPLLSPPSGEVAVNVERD